MNNWKIGTRITVGFATNILIAAALGIFALVRITNINSAAVEISTNSLPSVEVISAIKANSLETFGLILTHAVSNSKEEMAQIDAQITNARVRGSALYTRYTSLFTNDKDRQLFAAMQAARANFDNASDETLRSAVWEQPRPISRLWTWQ